MTSYYHGGLLVVKKYRVRLSEEERSLLRDIAKRLKGTSQKVRRANILLKADVDGPNWSDAKIAEALSCRTRTVENVRRRLVTEGFDAVLNRKNAKRRRDPKSSTGNRKPKSSLCGWASRPPDLPTGRYDCWPARSSNWKLQTRSALKRFAEH